MAYSLWPIAYSLWLIVDPFRDANSTGGQGFEPRLSPSKGDGLPLADPPLLLIAYS